MIMLLFDHLSKIDFLHYIHLRIYAALITSALLIFLFAPSLITRLKLWQREGQPIRTDGPKTHLKKVGTPTMGGLIILFVLLISTVLWCDWSSVYIWIVIGVMIPFGCIGFCDDYLKIIKNNHYGISRHLRLIIEFLIAIPAAYVFMRAGGSCVTFPFRSLTYDLGFFFIPFAAFIIVGSSNAVNLTDGLDGLAIVPIMIVALSFAIIAYLASNSFFSGSFYINPKIGELAVFLGAVIGAGLGFLWFNISPAAIFMGDIGSLSLGSVLGSIAIATKHEIILILIGAIFIIETISVIVQVVYFKLTGRRVFLMAPIHHHFEKRGWTESQVVIRFWIISFFFALIGLATLKFR